jgi:hypothetical protein
VRGARSCSEPPAAPARPALGTYQAELGLSTDGRYRLTPEGQPRVPDLVAPGSVIITNYDTGPYIVTCVIGPFEYRPDDGDGEPYQHYSLQMVHSAKFIEKPTRATLKGDSYINEVVAVDGRLLKLFEANTDEVTVKRFNPDAAELMGASVIPPQQWNSWGLEAPESAPELPPAPTAGAPVEFTVGNMKPGYDCRFGVRLNEDRTYAVSLNFRFPTSGRSGSYRGDFAAYGEALHEGLARAGRFLAIEMTNLASSDKCRKAAEHGYRWVGETAVKWGLAEGAGASFDPDDTETPESAPVHDGSSPEAPPSDADETGAEMRPSAPVDANEIIRAGYARDASIAELSELTGLKPNTVKKRAERMGLSDPARQKAAARKAMTALNEARGTA